MSRIIIPELAVHTKISGDLFVALRICADSIWWLFVTAVTAFHFGDIPSFHFVSAVNESRFDCVVAITTKIPFTAALGEHTAISTKMPVSE